MIKANIVCVCSPPSDIFPPLRESFPYSELGECFYLDELLVMFVVSDPLLKFSELRLFSLKHPSHTPHTQSGVIVGIYLGMDNNSIV